MRAKFTIMPLEYDVKRKSEDGELSALLYELFTLGYLRNGKEELEHGEFTIQYRGESFKADIAEYCASTSGGWNCKNSRDTFERFYHEKLDSIAEKKHGVRWADLDDLTGNTLLKEHWPQIMDRWESMRRDKERMIEFCGGEVVNNLETCIDSTLKLFRPHMDKPELEKYFPGDIEPSGETADKLSMREKAALNRKRDRSGRFK